ncbi:MAG: hypothetical protein JNK77_02765 [Saprospiraceae bacterium]|nr:hypothetical protein [Saprospiraceae bacterium]
MKRRHEVDDIFKHKLEHHTVPPPPDMWDRIAQVREKRAYPRMLPGRLIIAGSAAILVLSLAAAWRLYQQPANAPQLGNFFLSPISTEVPASASVSVDTDVPELAQAAVSTVSPGIAIARPVDNLETETTITLPSIETPVNADPQVAETTADNQTIAAESTDETQASFARNDWSPLAHLPTLSLTSPPMPLPQYIKCARFGGSTWRLHLEALVAPELPMRELRPRQIEAQTYARLRQQTEQSDYALSAALRLALVSESGWVLKTGLHYGQVNENFSFFNPNEQRIIITDIYGSDGHLIRTDTIVVNGAEYKADNRYQWLDIPVLAGYEMDFGKVTFALNAGAHINFLLSANGQFLAPEDLQRPVSFDGESNPGNRVFRPRIGVGWYASMGILYNVKPGWQLMLEPGFRIYPRSLTRSHFDVDQRYFISGINIGVRRAL